MYILELILFIGLCAGIVLMLAGVRRGGSRKQFLDSYLAPLGVKKVPNTAMRLISLKVLATLETRVTIFAVAITLLISSLFDFPLWFLFLQMLVVSPLAWFFMRSYRRKKIRAAFSDRFPEAIDSFMRAIQAGVPVETVLASLGDIYPGELGLRFRTLVQQLELGIPYREALVNFSQDLNLPDVDFFCAVLALHRETGSSLAAMLQSLSQMLRERRAVDRKLQSLTAETRGAANVLCILPFVIIGLQIFLNPVQMRVLIDDPTGRAILGYCMGSMIIGFLVIRRMSRMMEVS